ncbi:hypothetical protein SAMN05421686_1243 [Thalassolituus maritimus]|uniref:RiboL-PSP-HEPN domain-containing protein n=1 Tax=Thalassolituus maritimus TaxID=484498 RepID=A0A1N7QD86_9GAMM|nr:MAE_28990/MAE_18760 family HEPN-like nuclease [Thalassolituus maritimus]SIT20833.1 hypothetical protein SAMN05421686_1243 [Thalassolituus maritimus]
MFQSLSDFLSSIDGLINHLNYEKSCQVYFQTGAKKYTGEHSLEVEFRSFLAEKISPALTDSKVYSYKNGIISLYGFLERYVEDIIIEFLRGICELSLDYKSLPQEIRKNHLDASLDHINKLKKLRGMSADYRQSSLTEAVKNMHNCLVEAQEYALNYDAFVSHTSNFRYDSIHEIFTRIGIHGISRSCLDDAGLAEALSRKHSPTGTLEKKILISLLMSELDNLAQRRNEIAHGVRIDEIESLDMLQERIEIIRRYGLAIHSIVFSRLNSYAYQSARKIDLGRPYKVYGGIRVLEFQRFFPAEIPEECAKISVGDKVFAINENSSTDVICGSIVSIRNHDGNVDFLEAPHNSSFSIRVDFKTNSHVRKRMVFVGVEA